MIIIARKWSAQQRSRELLTAANKQFQVVIIGGGITGAGIARECALRNISFCLLDKNDFAFGTSSRSSKLFHGGLRYLASGDFRLVRESAGERNWLLSHFPNLVRPLGFIYPAFQHGKSKPHLIKTALKIYDLLSDSFSEYKNYRQARFYKPALVEALEPSLALQNPYLGKLLMAGFYYDTSCDDARVTLELIKESRDYGQGLSTALNYTEVTGYLHDQKGQICGVQAKDIINDQQFDIQGQCVVSSCGIWTDQMLAATDYREQRIFPTKGVHIVVPADRLGNRNAFALNSLDDGRFFFVLRRGKTSLIGTTDTAYGQERQGLDHPGCQREDCDYLLSSVNRYFPEAKLSDQDIISAYAGVRPLIRREGVKKESAISRQHEIFETPDGLVAIAGGKSTTHRKMAEDLLFYLVEQGRIAPFSETEYGQRGFSKIPFAVALTKEHFLETLSAKELLKVVTSEQRDYFYTQYGQGGIEIIEAINRVPQSGLPLLTGHPHCAAEIVYILEYEQAPRLVDILCRRTEAQWTIWHHQQSQLAEAVATIMAAYYNWSGEKKADELKHYLTYVKNSIAFLH